MGFRGAGSIESSVQIPLLIAQISEQPELLAVLGLDAVIVTADCRTAPPTGLDPLR
jgi:hypothetical protein